jgi:cytochrome c-type biogenesis protein
MIMDIILVSLSLMAGIFAFFSPCSAPLLPSYISYTVSMVKEELDYLSSFKLSISSSLGASTVYVVILFLQLSFFKSISIFFPILTKTLAVILIFIGFLILLDKGLRIVYLSSKIFSSIVRGAETILEKKSSLFLYGVVYALSSLSCSAPIIFMIASVAVTRGLSELLISSLLFIFGLSSLMFIVTLLSISFSQVVKEKLIKIVHYIDIFTPILLILAGIYILIYEFMIL